MHQIWIWRQVIHLWIGKQQERRGKTKLDGKGAHQQCAKQPVTADDRAPHSSMNQRRKLGTQLRISSPKKPLYCPSNFIIIGKFLPRDIHLSTKNDRWELVMRGCVCNVSALDSKAPGSLAWDWAQGLLACW